MTASGSHALLIFLLCGILIIAAVVPCHGEAVVDTDGKEVGLGSGPGFYQYWIRYRHRPTGVLGYLSSVPVNGSLCQNYVSLPTDPAIQRRATVFFPTSASNNTAIMQLKEPYEYRFVQSDTGACDAPVVWALGKITGTDRLFSPIIAGQEGGPDTRQSWFAVLGTGRKGQYWLCLSVGGVPCPDLGSYANSYQVKGNRVLGFGGLPGVVVQFERIYVRKDTAEQ